MLDPLDTLPPWRHEYPTLAYDVQDWSLGTGTASTPHVGRPRFIVPAGPYAGRPFRLTDRQWLFLLWWYALHLDGSWVMRGGSQRQSRGTGKSPGAGFVACTELVGPCRPTLAEDGRLVLTEHGQPIGKRASMPLVQIAATAESQTENVMQYVRAWLGRGSPLQLEYNLDPGRTVVYAPGGAGAAPGKLQVITSSSAAARGGTPTLVIAEETGEWVDSNGGTRFRATLGDNATKVVGGRVLENANVWRPGLGSVAERRWEAWELEEEQGRIPGQRPWLMDVREAPADADWSDADQAREAIEVVYDGVPWMDVDEIMSTVLDPAKPIRESMREYGNLRVSDLTTWVDRQAWDACGDATLSLHDGDEVVLFLDPSATDDATALVACRADDGLVVPLWVHEPHALDPDGRPSGDVDPAEIDRQVRRAFTTYRVLAFRSDVHPIEQLARSEWPTRYGSDLVLWSTKATSGRLGEPIAYDMRRVQLDFARACELVASEVARHELRHNADPVLGRHVGNTQRRPYREFVSVGKGDRARKIDAAVAAIGARDLRRTLIESDEYKRHVRRKSRKRRVTVLK